jgi:hypothetical protein
VAEGGPERLAPGALAGRTVLVGDDTLRLPIFEAMRANLRWHEVLEVHAAI